MSLIHNTHVYRNGEQDIDEGRDNNEMKTGQMAKVEEEGRVYLWDTFSRPGNLRSERRDITFE